MLGHKNQGSNIARRNIEVALEHCFCYQCWEHGRSIDAGSIYLLHGLTSPFNNMAQTNPKL